MFSFLTGERILFNVQGIRGSTDAGHSFATSDMAWKLCQGGRVLIYTIHLKPTWKINIWNPKMEVWKTTFLLGRLNVKGFVKTDTQ